MTTHTDGEEVQEVTKTTYKKLAEASLEMHAIRIETKKIKSKYEILGTELQMYFDMVQDKLEQADKHLWRFIELDRKDEQNG